MTLRRYALIMLGAAAGSILAAAPASAHATYVDSDPAKGAAVASPPSEVWVQFSEGVDEGSKLEVFDECGQQVDNGDSRISGTFSDTITVSISADSAGDYTVTWKVLSEDGHPVGGEYSFRSSGGDTCPGEEPPGGGGNGGGSGGGGGSGNTGGGSSGGGGSTSNDTEINAAAPGSGSGKSGDGHANHHGGGNPNGKDGKQKNGGGSFVDDAVDELTDGDQPPEAAPPSEDSAELPLNSLLVGFGFAALIGAAGGIVYAGIVAPRD